MYSYAKQTKLLYILQKCFWQQTHCVFFYLPVYIWELCIKHECDQLLLCKKSSLVHSKLVALFKIIVLSIFQQFFAIVPVTCASMI